MRTCFPAALGVLALCALPMSSGWTQSRQAATPANAADVVLKNAGADPIRVEIRTGIAGDCGQGRLVTTKSVAAGRTWTIRSSQPVCVRREQVASDGRKSWGAWQRKAPRAGQREEVTL